MRSGYVNRFTMWNVITVGCDLHDSSFGCAA